MLKSIFKTRKLITLCITAIISTTIIFENNCVCYCTETLHNFNSFSEEVSSLLTQKSTSASTNRLIVKAAAHANITDDTANICISGYNNLFIFQYDTTEQMNTAYEKFSQRDDVIFAEIDDKIKLNSENNIFLNETNIKFSNIKFTSETTNWGISKMNFNSFANFLDSNNKVKNDVIVGVVDTGIAENANDIFDNRILPGASFTQIDNPFAANKINTNYTDDNGHGTAVCGIIAQAAPSNVKILPVKSLNSEGEGSELSVYMGIAYAINNGAKIINLSCGAEGSSALYDDIMAQAYSLGVTVVVASGNEHQDVKNVTPSSIPSVITVSSIDKNLQLSDFSNYGDAIDFVAPGEELALIYYKGGMFLESGTSFSTPLISAAASMLYSCNINYSPDDIQNILARNAADIGAVGWDKEYGYGWINMEELKDDVYEYVITANGDANGDGEVNVIDAVYVLNSILYGTPLDNMERAKIAVYNTEEVTISHALAIMRVAAGVTSTYSVIDKKPI